MAVPASIMQVTRAVSAVILHGNILLDCSIIVIQFPGVYFQWVQKRRMMLHHLPIPSLADALCKIINITRGDVPRLQSFSIECRGYHHVVGILGR